MRSDDRPYTPADDAALSDLMATARQRDTATGDRLARQLAAEDARARRDMGDNPYPAGDQDEV